MVFLEIVLSGFLVTQPSIGSAAKPAGTQSLSVPGSDILKTIYKIDTGTASDFVVAAVRDLEKVVKEIKKLKGAEERKKEDSLRKMVSALLDLNHLGQRAMATHWDELGKTGKGRSYREQYMNLFRSLVEENYMEQARKYIGGNYVLTLTEESQAGDGSATVKGRIKKPDLDVIVEFELLKVKDAWRIVDIKLDATSLEGTYRSSFNRIIKKKGGLDTGFPELLSTMRKRLAELKQGGATRL